MSNRSSVGRMLILLSFAIITLIIYSARLSNRNASNFYGNKYNKYIPWEYDAIEHTILLHSIDIGIISFTAFSTVVDSIIRIPFSEKEIKFIKNEKNKYNLSNSKCINCHI